MFGLLAIVTKGGIFWEFFYARVVWLAFSCRYTARLLLFHIDFLMF